jgi:hypothetical protein
MVAWIAVGMLCTLAHAQNMNRVPDANKDMNAVDASVHAGVDEYQQAQSPQEVGKRPTTSIVSYSHWAFQSVTELPTTRFWLLQAAAPSATDVKDVARSSTVGGVPLGVGAQIPGSSGWPAPISTSTLTPPSNSNTEKVESLQGPFNTLSIARSQYGLAGSQRFNPAVPQLSPQAQIGEFVAPFHKKQFGLASDSSSPHVFPKKSFSSQRDQALASRRNSHPKKSPDSEHAGAIAGFSRIREKQGRSLLTIEVD